MARQMQNIIVIALLALGYIEVATGLLQWAGFIASHHNSYAFTGTFYNPGPYACYLAVIVPIAAFAIKSTNCKLTKIAGEGMVLLSAILIPSTLSRTALLAGVAGCVVALYESPHNNVRKNGRLILIATIVAIAAGGTALYIAKKDSADGRMLMWKVAAGAACKVPSTGVGWDNVAGIYGEYQEKYFASGNRSEQEKMVADAPEYVFNEYLQTAIAFGPTAALIMITLIAGAIIMAWRHRQYGLAGSLIAVAIVMAGSYPLQFPLFALTIAVILIASYLCATNIAVRIIGFAATGIALTLFLTHSQKTDVESIFSVALNLHRAGDCRRSNQLLIPLLQKSSDPMVPNIIGKNYQALSMPDSAEYFFRKSAMRCPNRMYPHYLLMKLYTDSLSADRQACVNEAETILTMKVKVQSPAIDDMQKEARKVLEQ